MKKALAVLIFAVVLSSFTSLKKPAGDGFSWIPAGFDTRNSTLLIMNMTGPGNERAQKIWNKATADMKYDITGAYTYNYEFVSLADIDSNPKYADKEKYRYALMNIYTYGDWVRMTSTKTYEQEPKTSIYNVSGTTFHIYDRAKNIHYGDAERPNSYVLPAFHYAITHISTYLEGL